MVQMTIKNSKPLNLKTRFLTQNFFEKFWERIGFRPYIIMEESRIYFMHQLHEEINNFKNFGLRAKNLPNPNGYDSSQNDATKWSYTLKYMILVYNQIGRAHV